MHGLEPVDMPLAPKGLKVLLAWSKAGRYTFGPQGAKGLMAQPKVGYYTFGHQGAKGYRARSKGRLLYLLPPKGIRVSRHNPRLIVIPLAVRV